MSKILENPNWSPERRAAFHTVALQEQANESARNAETVRQAQIEKEKRDVELAKQVEWHRNERAKEIAAEQKKLRETESANVDAILRERYFAANSFATETDYLRDKDQMRSEYMLERMKGRENAEQMIRSTSLGVM